MNLTRVAALAVALLAIPALVLAVTRATHLRRPGHGVQVRLSPITIAPGTEREVCQLVTLPNRRAFDAREIAIAMPSGPGYTSHHFAIFLYQGEHPELVPDRRRRRPAAAGGGLLRRGRWARLPLQLTGRRICGQGRSPACAPG